MLVYSLLFKYNSREAGQVEQVRRIEREPPNMHGDRLDTELELMYGSQETAAHVYCRGKYHDI